LNSNYKYLNGRLLATNCKLLLTISLNALNSYLINQK